MFSRIFNSIKKWWYNRGAIIPPVVPERNNQGGTQETHGGGVNLLWYPKAIKGSGMRVQGWYANGYPVGAVVHFTAGQCDTEQHAKDSLSWGIGEGYTFFVIGPTGVVYQNFPLSHWGYHAGASSYPGLGSGVSSKLVGIEVACAGMVSDQGGAWFGKLFAADRLRKVKKGANIQDGTYVKYTPEQEEALIALLVWLKKNNPRVFDIQYIVGHDEVSPNRKNDPGGSLSMTMAELRALIKTRVN